MGVIADLMVKVGADVGSFRTGMHQVATDINEAETGGGRLGSMFAGAGLLAAGAITGVVAFGVAAVEKTMAAGQAAFQMSERFGIAADQASAWLTVARHLGVDSDQLGAGFKFLSKNVEAVNLSLQSHAIDARTATEQSEKLRLATEHYNDTVRAHGRDSMQAQQALLSLQGTQDSYNKIMTEAGAHLGSAGAAFQALGLQVFDTHGKLKDANELMLESADIFAKMPDGVEKTGLAIKLFGKNGMEMLPVLNLGRKGLEDLMAQGKQTGEVMSKDQVEAAHKLFLEQQKLNSELTGFTTMIATNLLPIALQFIQFVTGTAVPAIVAWAKPWVAELNPAIQSFTKWLLTLGPELRTGWGIFQRMAPIIGAIAAAWVLWNIALAVTEGLQAVIMGVQFIAGLVAIASKVGLLTVAQWALNLAMDANPIGVVILAVAALAAGVVWAYNNVGWFHDAVNAAWDGLKRFGEWIWSWLKPVLDWLGQRLSDIGGALKSVGDFLGSDNGNANAGHSRMAAGGHRAGGGSVYAGAGYWVGEQGKEWFEPDSNGMISPHGSGPGGTSVAVYVTSGADPYAIAAEVGWELQKLRRRR